MELSPTINNSRINQHLDQILTVFPYESTLLAVDFDECVIDSHLSRLVTNHYQYRYTPKPESLMLNGVSALADLTNAYIGLDMEEFKSTLLKISKGVQFKPDFVKLLQLSQQQFFPIFVSSGIEEAIKVFSQHQGMDIPLIGTSMETKSSIITGPYKVVSDEHKQHVVEYLFQQLQPKRIITVGHSVGDVQLIQAGTTGLRFSLNDHPHAIAAADHVIDKFTDLLNYI